MNKFVKYICILICSILITVCVSKRETTSLIDVEKIVTDYSIINNISNEIFVFQYLDKTYNLYLSGSGDLSDYDMTDKLTYGIEYALIFNNEENLSNEEINELNNKGIVDINKSVTVSEIAKNINQAFNTTTLKKKTISGCPSYIYDEEKKLYYVKRCNTEKSKSITIYIDKITNIKNYYYADVYVGIIENNVVYGDLEKNKIVQLLDENSSYNIEEKEKNSFTKFVYKFTKNSDGNYVFTSFTK